MDRYLASSRTMPAGPAHAAVVAAGLALIALAPIMVATLRLIPPLRPADAGLPWLPLSAGALTTLVVGTSTVICLGRGLARGSWPGLATAGGLGALTAGLAVATLRAARDAPAFPDAGLPVVALISAGMLLIARLLPEHEGSMSRARSVAVWLILFAALEASLAAALLLSPGPELAPWILAPAAAVASAAALVGSGGRVGAWLPVGSIAGGLVALALARAGTVDPLPGLLALGAGAVACALAATRSPVTMPLPGEQREDPTAVPARSAPVESHAASAHDDAVRLARELRGTIEELLRARHTIELQRLELSRVATVDALTGVATRRAILDRLRIEAGEARRYNHPVAVLLLEVEDFGRLNREHGGAIGDEVLREVALRLRLRIRAADALGRIGDDRFMALLPHTDEGGAALFADALRRRLVGRPVETAAGELDLAVSIGVAFMRPGMSLDDEELLAAAEEALASARAAGGSRIAFDRLHGLIRLDERREPGGRAG